MDLDNFHRFKNTLEARCKLIAVSKGQSIEKIQALYDEGQRDFGENFLQELQKRKTKEPSQLIRTKSYVS